MEEHEYQKIIENQQKDNELLKKDNELLKKDNELLKKLVEELCRRLRIYENPHMPSSRRIIKEKKEEREPKKRGAPEGHEGATRAKPAPNRIVNHKRPQTCPSCHGNNLKTKGRKDIIEDIKIMLDVAQINYFDCMCKDCGKAFSTRSEDLPLYGGFGPGISSLWTNLHYIGMIPFERLSMISENCLGIPITPAGLHNVIYRTADIFEPEFDGIKENVKESSYVGSDETRYSFNGKTNWLWDISTQEDVLVLLRKSRNSNVLEEVLGEKYDGILNSDCFSAYEKYKASDYQKCWAHIIRDSKDLAKHNEEGEKLHEELSRMIGYINRTKENSDENTPKVKFWIRRQKRIMKSWSDKTYESKAVSNLVKRINKYVNHWFTCLKYDFVEPTNNAREREIRKNVLARKISGCHRSEKGKRAREIMMSNILTMQKRGQNPFEFIATKIRSYNSGETFLS